MQGNLVNRMVKNRSLRTDNHRRNTKDVYIYTVDSEHNRCRIVVPLEFIK